MRSVLLPRYYEAREHPTAASSFWRPLYESHGCERKFAKGTGGRRSCAVPSWSRYWPYPRWSFFVGGAMAQAKEISPPISSSGIHADPERLAGERLTDIHTERASIVDTDTAVSLAFDIHHRASSMRPRCPYDCSGSSNAGRRHTLSCRLADLEPLGVPAGLGQASVARQTKQCRDRRQIR